MQMLFEVDTHGCCGLQAYPQSWRYTALTFNCVLVAASVFFLACTSAARRAPSDAAHDDSTTSRADAALYSANGSSADNGSSATVHVPSYGHQRRSRQERSFAQRYAAAHRARGVARGGLETVEECASSAERLSSMETPSIGSFRTVDADDKG